jgi:glutathione S-transferase
MKPRILYFDIRGRAEPLRLLLEDVGVEYPDQQVTLEQWPETRATIPFGRMPVYSEGDLEIAESFAIMHYLGRKHGRLLLKSSNPRC